MDLETREILPKKESLIKTVLNIQKGRKPQIPPHPKTLAELDIPEEWQKLVEDGGIFYDSIVDSEVDRIIIYTSESNLIMLNNCKDVAADGTFKVPKNVRQIFMLHGFISNRFLPLVYVFMEKKNKESYKKVFRKLQKFKVVNYFHNL